MKYYFITAFGWPHFLSFFKITYCCSLWPQIYQFTDQLFGTSGCYSLWCLWSYTITIVTDFPKVPFYVNSGQVQYFHNTWGDYYQSYWLFLAQINCRTHDRAEIWVLPSGATTVVIRRWGRLGEVEPPTLITYNEGTSCSWSPLEHGRLGMETYIWRNCSRTIYNNTRRILEDKNSSLELVISLG